MVGGRVVDRCFLRKAPVMRASVSVCIFVPLERHLNHNTFVRELLIRSELLRLGTQSLATCAPVAGSIAAAFVLRHGRHLRTRSPVQARLPAADVVGATLQRILALLPRGVAKFRLATERASALTIIYPASMLRLVQIAALRRRDKYRCC